MHELMRLSEQAKDGPEVIDAQYIASVVEPPNKVEHHAGDPGVDRAEGNGEK